MNAYIFALGALSLGWIASATEQPRSGEALVGALLEFDPEFRLTGSEDIPLIAGAGSVVKADRGFHFAVAGDQFEAICNFLTRHYGAPVQQAADPLSGMKSATFGRVSADHGLVNVIYVPEKERTAVFAFGRRLPKAPESGDAPPRILRDSDSSEAAEGGAEIGWALLRVKVDYYGTVASYEVLDASKARFRSQAIDWIRHLRFEPAFKDGRPIEVTFRQKISFVESKQSEVNGPERQRKATVPTFRQRRG